MNDRTNYSGHYSGQQSGRDHKGLCFGWREGKCALLALYVARIMRTMKPVGISSWTSATTR